GGLRDGKTAIVMGVANRRSMAWSIAEAFSREGARLVFTFQGERQEKDVRELAGTLPHSVILPCDVARDEELAGLAKSIETQGLTLDALVHSIAFANRDDLGGAYVETSRAGFALALDVSAFSLVAAARHLLPVLKPGAAVVRTGR